MREFRSPHVSLTRVRKADQSNITQGNIWKKMKADGKSKRKKACESGMQEALTLFAEECKRGRILPGKKRIVVKEYPPEAAAALKESGFVREVQDDVLY